LSRYTVENESKQTIAYGHDHAVGYFFQVYSPEDEWEPVVDEDSLFTGMNNGKMLALIEEYKAPVEKAHLDAITCDLAF